LSESFNNKVYTRGVDFTNILRPAFTIKNPKSAKKTDSLTVLCALLGPAGVKALSKMLEK